MNRLLKIVDWWYGEDIRVRVFEPLLADCDTEIRDRRSVFTRVRWSAAFVTAFIVCIPRATVDRLPAALIGDLALRVLGFGAAAFALQWIFGAGASKHAAEVWPPSLVTALPYLIFPVVWRMRTAAIPHHQKRLLTIAFAIAAVSLSIIAARTWPLAAAYAAAAIVTTVFGWIAGDRQRQTRTEMAQLWWVRIIMTQAVLAVAMWPIKFAIDVRFAGEFWSGYSLLNYLYAALITQFTKHTSDAKAPRSR